MSNHYNVVIEKGHSPVNDAIIKFIASQIRGRYLDVGCNTGFLLEIVPNGFGVDLSPLMIDIALKKGLPVQLANAEKLPFKDKEFDTVVLSCVLEQTEDWKKALSEAMRVGKRVIGICNYPGKSQWGRIGENPWVKCITPPEEIEGALIMPFDYERYYFEVKCDG
jgi:ubiquinone/menaquinone biosynthesis C-methylase UbiE